MKGKCEDELNEFLKKSKNLGLSLSKKVEFLLPFENSNRTVLDFIKESKTKDKYPRRIDSIRADYINERK